MLKKIKVLAAAAAVALLALPLPAFAFDPPTGVPENLDVLVGNVLSTAILIAGAAAMIFLVIGGYSYVTSGGDKMKLQDAQGKITSAVVGLAIILCSWLVINVVCDQVFGHACVTIGF